MPLIGSIVPIRNKLAYPAGIRPGFDPTLMPYNALGRSVLFSGVAFGGNFLRLDGQLAGAIHGAPTAAIDGALGPSLFVPASAGVGFTYSAIFGGIGQGLTLAAIFRPTTAFGTNQVIMVLGANTPHTLRLSTTGQLTLVVSATTTTYFNNLTAGVPYFVAAVLPAASAPSPAVLVNLNTGSIQSGFGTGNNSANNSNNTIVALGNSTAFGATALTGNLTAAAALQLILSPAQLLAWAADPWAFWYPRQPPAWKGTTVVVSGFKTYWARPRNFIQPHGAAS